MEREIEKCEKEKIHEIEKRSLLNEQDFFKLKQRLEAELQKIGEKKLTTYLFNKPNFIRIRLTAGEDFFVVTEKTGDYHSQSREETNSNLPLNILNNYIKGLNDLGYTECTKLKTERLIFKYTNDIRIELNIIDYLGMIVEIEATTMEPEKITDLELAIDEVFKAFNLTILDPNTYQKMMNDMYLKATRPTTEQFNL